MADAITDDLSGLFADTLIAQPGTLDLHGEFTAVGSPSNLACYISGKARLIRDADGNEVVSSLKVTVGSAPGLTVHGYRYTLPARFDPRTDLEAIGVKHVADENGAHHEVVFFP